jgi:hypothetical protein
MVALLVRLGLFLFASGAFAAPAPNTPHALLHPRSPQQTIAPGSTGIGNDPVEPDILAGDAQYYDPNFVSIKVPAYYYPISDDEGECCEQDDCYEQDCYQSCCQVQGCCGQPNRCV